MKAFENTHGDGVNMHTPIEKENVTILTRTLLSTYYDMLIDHANASFSNLVQTGDRIEDGFKTSKIKVTRYCLTNHQMEL